MEEERIEKEQEKARRLQSREGGQAKRGDDDGAISVAGTGGPLKYMD
jgi:hypothetical protein